MGIEKSITLLAVVAVSIIMAVTLAGWMTGIWTIYSSRTEVLKLLPDTYIDCKQSPPQLYLHIYSNVHPSITIYRVEVASIGAPNFTRYVLEEGPRPIILANGDIVLKPGTYVWLVYSLEKCPTGMYYGAVNVYVYTTRGNKYAVPATLR